MIEKSENIKKFEEAISVDENLRNRYEAALKKITDEKLAGSDGEAMVKAAKELGFEISIDEWNGILRRFRNWMMRNLITLPVSVRGIEAPMVNKSATTSLVKPVVQKMSMDIMAYVLQFGTVQRHFCILRLILKKLCVGVTICVLP